MVCGSRSEHGQRRDIAARTVRSGFLMVATGASPWNRSPHNTEACRADSFSSVTEFNTIRGCGHDTVSACINRPLWGALLLIGAFFHGLAPVANMNPARHWGPAPTPCPNFLGQEPEMIKCYFGFGADFFCSDNHVKAAAGTISCPPLNMVTRAEPDVFRIRGILSP